MYAERQNRERVSRRIDNGKIVLPKQKGIRRLHPQRMMRKTLQLEPQIGFEFESNINVRNTNNEIINYHEIIINETGSSWYASNDCGHLEFVTIPLNISAFESDGCLSEMIEFAQKLENETSTFEYKTINTNKIKIDGYKFKKQMAEVLAAPQATIDIQLYKMEELLEELKKSNIDSVENRTNSIVLPSSSNEQSKINGNNKENNSRKSLIGEIPEHAEILFRAKNGVDKIEQIKDDKYKSLRGLMILVVSYLLTGNEFVGIMKYSKMIAPIMARNSFYSMYHSLSDEEKIMFTIENVLKAANMDGEGKKHIYKAGFEYYYMNNDNTIRKEISYGPSREEWINSIINGVNDKSTDLMSKGSNSTVVKSSESLGNMPMKKIDNKEYAILELRRIPKHIPINKWNNVMKAVANVLKLLS